MSTNTILIDCNRSTAVQSDANTTSTWTNEIGTGLHLNPGDRVSVMSASINEIGSGADTIEFSGDYLGTNVDGDKMYDNEATSTISYYKVADGDNVLILPRKMCWDNINAGSDDGLPANVDQIAASYDPNFAWLYRRRQDGRRYTIYKGNMVTSDVVRNIYTKYTQKIKFAVNTGYNTPSDISSTLTEILHASASPTQQNNGGFTWDGGTSYTGGFTYSLTCPSTVFNLFHCANASNFSKTNYEAKNDAYLSAFQYIGVMRPQLFEAGRAIYGSEVKQYNETTGLMTTGYEYGPHTLKLWKTLFDAQRDDPDQYALLQNGSQNRFIHVNRTEGASITELGDDEDMSKMSVRQYIYYDPSTSEIVTDSETRPSYGTMYKSNVGGTDYIAFKLRLDDKRWTGAMTSARFAGWDWHFSAFGNDCCLLWSGMKDVAKTNVTTLHEPESHNAASAAGQPDTQDVVKVVTTITNSNDLQVGNTVYKLSSVVDQVYLGAINPSVSFDTSQSRFFISGLHTPRKQRNTQYAGSTSAGADAINPDEGKDVYQINPIYEKGHKGFSFNPEERSLVSSYTNQPAGQDPVAYADSTKINLLDFWTVYDASSGVFIESFGVDEPMWEQSLWGKLGFTYDQLISGYGDDRQARATNQSVNMSPVSTNADVNSTQILDWSVNLWGATQQMSMMPTMGQYEDQTVFTYRSTTTTGPITISTKHTQVATITESAVSTRIVALHLPVKQTSSHWTIRSSLIDNSQYLSTHGLSPVIAVVDKSYSGSDFYFLNEYNVDFTVTKPTTVTSITTSIHLPDGTLARTDGSSAVIYKIVKMNNAPLSILNDFVKPGKK